MIYQHALNKPYETGFPSEKKPRPSREARKVETEGERRESQSQSGLFSRNEEYAGHHHQL